MCFNGVNRHPIFNLQDFHVWLPGTLHFKEHQTSPWIRQTCNHIIWFIPTQAHLDLWVGFQKFGMRQSCYWIDSTLRDVEMLGATLMKEILHGSIWWCSDCNRVEWHFYWYFLDREEWAHIDSHIKCSTFQLMERDKIPSCYVERCYLHTCCWEIFFKKF